MTRALIAAALLGLAALPAAAQATEEQKAALAAAIEANGCKVTADNNAAILGQAGLGTADAATVVDALIASGLAVIEGGALVLISPNCP